MAIMTLKSRRVKRPSAMLDEAAVVPVGGKYNNVVSVGMR